MFVLINNKQKLTSMHQSKVNMERDYDFLHLYFSSTNTINKGVFLQVCDVFILEAFSQQCYFEVEKNR